MCELVSISEENKRGLSEIRNEGAPASIPQKQKTSKAERRAIQEAQRAAKAAAKEAGNCTQPLSLFKFQLFLLGLLS
jgi:hypothetical protein